MTDSNIPFLINLVLPDGALARNLPSHPHSKDRRPTVADLGSKVIWFSAQKNDFSTDRTWHARSSNAQAVPVRPNTSVPNFINEDGLTFHSGQNTGYVIDHQMRLGNQFTVAVLFQSTGDAKTICTLNPVEQKSYLFLSEKQNQLTLSDDAGLMDPLSLQSDQEKSWVHIGYSQGHVILSTQDAHVSSQCVKTERQLAASLVGLQDVFIGCRSHRKGLAKTLGDFTLYHLILVPHRNLLRDDAGQAELSKLCTLVGQDAL